ncbi:SdpI family protein [Oribacterium sp. HCP28S3_H8]|uniref:SdpI family protein n=1 Tax=Oribacterium sp. HCP28S3_H8 TaxID=3438945 RepID=UPI003F89F704
MKTKGDKSPSPHSRLSAFLLAVHWLCALITAHDPRKQNINPKMYTLILWIVPVVSLAVAAIEYSVNLGYPVDITFYMELFLAAVFLVVGNYLPKTRQNYTIGIMIPWTPANEENWNRTHRRPKSGSRASWAGRRRMKSGSSGV